VHRKRDLPGVFALADKLRHDYGASIEKLDARGMAELLGTDVYHGGWLDHASAHLHPLNLLLGEARAAEAAGVRVFEHARAVSYHDAAMPRVSTTTGAVSARFVVLAMNGYLGGFEPRIAGKIMPVNNYIVATEPLNDDQRRRILPTRVAAADSRFVINYFRRSVDDRLLFGGGESYTSRFPNDIAGFVRPHLAAIYPELAHARFDYAWGGRLAITMNRLPHFGRLSPRIYFAQGYSGHGVGMAHLAGQMIAEAIAGVAERFDIFAHLPTRTFPGGRWLRWPGLALGMTYYALRDRL
jgi:gamma-glutamylputrescine oxidase